MAPLRRLLRSRLGAALRLGLLAGAATLGLRAAGLFEFVELAAHDLFVRLRAGSVAEPAPVTLVGVSEADIEALGHPLPDGVLAGALERLLADGARAIGLDLYRSQPVPPGSERFEAVVRGDPRIVLLEKFGTNGEEGTPPPSWAAPEQVGFSDLPLDAGGLLRRGLLYLWDDQGRPALSLALRLALAQLRPEGIGLGPDPEHAACVRLGASSLCPFAGNDGGYVRADARGFQMLLDYRDGGSAFPIVSLGDVLADRLDPALVRGRSVILGTMAASVRDDFYTPLSEGLRSKLPPPYGAEIHAHALSQLLRHARGVDAPTRTLGELVEAGLIVLSGLAGAALALALRPLWGSGSALLAGTGAILGGGFLLFRAGWWIPVVPPTLAWLGSAALVVAHFAAREHRENRLLVAMVGPTVAREIRGRGRELLEQGGLRPRLTTVTVLVSDLEGFTSASAQLDPLALMDWLNHYMRAMAGAIEAHQGVIDAYIGDGIKADFGVASEEGKQLDRDAVNAVRAALAMGEALERLNAEWRVRDLPTGRMRIGINTGPATVGSLGAGSHIKYTSIGDTVNAAARLESFDKEGFAGDREGASTRVLVSGQTLARLGGRFETQPLGEFELRGRKTRVGIHRVIRSKPDGLDPSAPSAMGRR